jgi:hypothetical protein
MSEWQIELIGNESDIKLVDDLLSDSPYKITTIGNRKLLSLPGVSKDADIHTVKAASDQLIDVINGAARLYSRQFKGLSFVKVSRLDSNGKRISFGYITASETDYTLTAINPNDRTLLKWVKVALSDEEIARALYLYGSLEPNWKNLYMVLEVIEDSFGGERYLLNAKLIPKKDIKLFKQTAGSYKAIGREARHGTLKFEPPHKQMTLTKAQDVISTLLREWLKIKGSQNF